MGIQDTYKSWRKREADSSPDKEEFSRNLRRAHDLILRRKYADALGRLDQHTENAHNPASKAKILGLIGDSLVKRGKRDEAIAAYERAEIVTSKHSRAWLRPVIARVKLQLLHGAFDDAFETARRGVARSLKEERNFRTLKRKLEKQIAERGEVVIMSRPHRSSVVATRFGHLFLRSGELEAANFFFEKVIQVNPRGGCRARLGLAEIALRSQDYQRAHYWAKDGIINGKFQAKTLSGWPILIAARRGEGKSGLPLPVLKWLRGHWDSGVGQRALQHTVEELRKNEDPLWHKLAWRWLQAEPENAVLQCHLYKLLLSDAKIRGADASDIRKIATSFWETDNLSLREQISAMRAIAKSQLGSGAIFDDAAFVSRIRNDFGVRGQDRARQALAAVYWEFDQESRAVEILTTVAESAPTGSKRWGQANWRLAQWKYQLGDAGASSEIFLSIAEQKTTPERIRNFALVDALRMAGVAGRDDLTLRAKPFLQAALAMINDPELLLDMSRQLGSAPDCHQLFEAYRAKGEQGITRAIEAATEPSLAATLLFKYARRQNDWGDFDGTIRVWETMDAQRRAWIWSPQEEYWEYLAYVMRAYTWRKLPAEAESIATEYVNDPATTADGVAILGNSYASLLIYQDRMQEGLTVFKRVVDEAPQHPYAAYAYYWFALRSAQENQPERASTYAMQIEKCLGDRSKLGWQLELRCQAQLIRRAAERGSLAKMGEPVTGFEDETVSRAERSILRDLAKL